MARWMGLVSEWLKAIYAEMKAHMMIGPYLQVDEAPIRYLDPGQLKNRLKLSLGGASPGGDMIYEWHTTRRASCLERLIPIDLRVLFNVTVIEPMIDLPTAVKERANL